MAGNIQVNSETLTSQAQVYIQARDGIEAELQKINSTNSQIGQEWHGAAFEGYMEQYEQLAGEVKKFEELLTSINQQVRKYAATMAERDAQDKSNFGLN